ncbi:MAG: LruC domain-containing protein [Chitinophagaceae bacterium]
MLKHVSGSRYVTIFLATMFFASCVKSHLSEPATTGDNSNPLGLTAPDFFNFQTSVRSSLDITLLTNDNKPISGVMVNVLDKPSEEGGSIIYTAISDVKGKISGDITVPTYYQSVIVNPDYIGLMHNAAVKINGGKITCTLGGSEGYSGNVIPNTRVYVNAPSTNGKSESLSYHYMSTFNSSGKPDNLLSPNDVISAKTLSYINASLPEQKPVPTYHPEYLKSNYETNLRIVETSDVWITFVHEGAGYQNTLSYFTYPTNKPPKITSDIDSLHIILPNASLSGSGGALTSGNKVMLGKFYPGTSIGFCLITNGWSDQSKTVGSGLNKFYSIDELNREATADLRRHTVLLNDEEDHIILSGFEDQSRDGSSDNDFNDIIFYTSSNPYTGIARSAIAPIDKPGDKDGDGVADVYDKYPTDPLRAYNNTYPKAGSYASIAFEDTWPNTGDYDMNDLVIDYQYVSVQNAQNKSIELYANYVCRASGASYKNGFGVQFPFASAAVASVSGSRVTDRSIVTLNANGCEAGQSKAVIIPFTDIYALMPPAGSNYINTQFGVPFITPDTVKMKLTFTSALTLAQLGLAPFNQFIILDKTRGKEVHLPGELPTDKVNLSLFNTVQDNTIPSISRYYKTRSNLPFAISVPEKFDYPFEGKIISKAYLNFISWAESGGMMHADWYKDSSSYRSKPMIYR